jgi:Ca2+-binding RTX toxin-like protein
MFAAFFGSFFFPSPESRLVDRGVITRLPTAQLPATQPDPNDLDHDGRPDDILIGTSGIDVWHAGLGNDQLRGRDGNDKIYGDDGNDTIAGDEGNDLLEGGAGDDIVLGGSGNDIVSGDDGTDRLSGESGNDIIDGGAGNDRINGGSGNDIITGGAGRDIVSGEAGADIFVFNEGDFASASPDRADCITDFNHGQADTIDLTDIDANTRAAGEQWFTFLGEKAFTGRPGQLRYEAYGNGVVVLADTNGDRVADFAIRLDNVTKLVETDFIL